MDANSPKWISDAHELSVDGVWRLDENALLALDALIQEECTRMQIDAKKRLDNAVKKARDAVKRRKEFENLPMEQIAKLKDQIKDEVTSKSEMETTTAVTITLRGGGQRTSQTCKQLLQDGTLDKELVVSIRVYAKCCGTEFEMAFPSTGDITSHFTKKMDMKAFAKDSNQANHIRARLLRWSNDTKAPSYYYWWVSLQPLQWIFLFLTMLVLTFFIPSPKGSLKAEAKALLDEGVNQNNRDRAIEVILSHIAETPRSRVPTPIWIWCVFLTAIALSIAFSFAPYDAIGIGKGRRSIENRRWFYEYAKWIFLGIVIFGIIPSILGNLFTDLIKNK